MITTSNIPTIKDIESFSEVNTEKTYVLQVSIKGVGSRVILKERPEEVEETDLFVRFGLYPEDAPEYILDAFKVWVYDTYWSE